MSLLDTRFSPLGESIEAWAPGFHVYGITVDNPSGWWLLIAPGNYYVPPFTFGWRQYLNGSTSVSILCVQGPGALQSQNIGNGITVVLTAEKIDNSAGYTTLGPGAITADLIAAGAITAGAIAAGTITSVEIAANTIVAGNIANGAIGTLQLAAGATIDNAVLAATATLAALAAEVDNVGSTVIIDATGITILNGFLSIADEFGATVLGASGFSGSWNSFVALGIYNGNFAAGTVGTVPLGRTSALPYWTVSNVAGTPTLAFLSGGGVKFSWSVTSTTKRILSDKVPILPGRAYNSGFATTWNRGNGTITLTLVILWFKADGVTPSSTASVTVLTETHASGTGGLPILAQDYFAQAPADAYFAQYQLSAAETGTHSATNAFSVYSAWLNPLLQSTPYIYIDQLEVGRDSGLSAPSHFYGDITLDTVVGTSLLVGTPNAVVFGDVQLSRSAASQLACSGNFVIGTAGILFDGSTAAEMALTDGGLAVMVKAKSILLSSSYADPDPATAGIQFGADVNLNRRAANVLHTDDELEYVNAARALEKTTSLSLAHNAWTQITSWSTTPWATGGTASQNNGIKVTRAGLYHITGVIEFQAATDYTRLIVGVGVGANTTPSTPAAIDESTHSPNTANIARHVQGSWDLVLAANDVVGLFGHHVNGAAAARNCITAKLSLFRVSD